jgi:restriction endonuclease Mrr
MDTPEIKRLKFAAEESIIKICQELEESSGLKIENLTICRSLAPERWDHKILSVRAKLIL